MSTCPSYYVYIALSLPKVLSSFLFNTQKYEA